MSLPVKRQHEESGGIGAVGSKGIADVVASGLGLGLGKVQQGMEGGSASALANAMESSRPAKVARHEHEGEYFGSSKREGGGGSGVEKEVLMEKEKSEKEKVEKEKEKEGRAEIKMKVREHGGEVKLERDPMREGLKGEREGRGGGAAAEVKVEKDVGGWGDGKEGGRERERERERDRERESRESNKEFLGRTVKGEEPWGGGGLELAENVNFEAQRKRSPREGEVKVREGKDMALPEVKREREERENRDREREKEERKEKERKEEKRSERKEDSSLQPHSIAPEKEIEREEREREREKGEKEREREKERSRERSRDKEKEGGGGRGEKREKREKERERDSHRRERAERGEEREDLVRERDEGNKDDIEMTERKPRGEKEGRDRVRERERERERERGERGEKEKEKERDGGEGGGEGGGDGGGGEKRKKRVREAENKALLEREAMLETGDGEDAGGGGGGGGGEKDKDAVLSYGVQQRKRMLRPRGQLNPSARDSRSRFRPKDNEGTQGQSESSVLQYRIGEGMPELAKLRRDFEAAERNNATNSPGPTVEIRIAAELATTSNRQIRGSQLWGTDIYTDDSDIVAVLMHTGYYTPTAAPPPHSIAELRATIRIFESQKTYTSTLRNSLRSRAWGGGSGCSFSVERCRITKQGGGSVELEPCLIRTPSVAPTLAPAASERTVTTRAASSSAYRQQRFMQEVTIQYNLCNEPWLKYSMSIVADRGLKKSQFTSARLKKGDVLYVETHSTRYELAYDGERTTCNGATTATSAFPQSTTNLEKMKEKWNSLEKPTGAHDKGSVPHVHNGEKLHASHSNNGEIGGSHQGHSMVHHNGEPHEHYRWSKCKRPLPLSSMRSKGVPLPADYVEVLEDSLAWEEVQWSPTSVWVRGTEYILARAHFFTPQVDEMDE